MILKGEITPSLRTGSKVGFRSLRFSKVDLGQFVVDEPVAPAVDEPAVVEGATQIDAEVITGFSRETLFCFEKLGMLKRVAGQAYRDELGLEHDPDRIPGDRILELWHALSETVRSLGKLSKIPPRLQSERFYFNDASFMSSFEVVVDRDSHTIWLTMRCDPGGSPRRWKWFQRNQAAVAGAMPELKETGTGGVTGTLRIASASDVKAAACRSTPSLG